jgi:thioredoxin-dependent peroxiredoxin
MKTALLLAVLALPARAKAPAEPAAPAVGAPAPEFTLSTQEGKPLSLKDLRGKWVVLYFYPKDFTGGCTLEAHNFQTDLPKYKKKKAVVVGVSVQSAESHKSFCEKEGLNFKVLSDVDRGVSTLYGSLMKYDGQTLSARNTFIIGPDGTLRRRFLKVDPVKHSQEVLAALAELQKK